MSSDVENFDDLLNEHNSWPVQIYTLGQFDVIRRNEQLPVTRKVQRRPLTLLKAIIAFGGQNVSEETLTDAIWPDAEGDAAHFALTSAVYRLRRLLGQGDLIVRRENRISLDARRMWVDAWCVERFLDRSEHFVAAANYIAMARLVRRAAELHKGNFLDGENNAPWAQAYASRLSRWLLRQVILVGKQFETDERPEDAVRWYEQALRIDPCAEDACRRLMIIYHRLGRPADVIHVYRQCRNALSRRLGINPSAQTQAVLKELLPR